MFRYNFSGLKWQSFPLHQPAIFPIKPSFCDAFSETFLKSSVKNECINKNLTEIPGTGAKKAVSKTTILQGEVEEEGQMAMPTRGDGQALGPRAGCWESTEFQGIWGWPRPILRPEWPESLGRNILSYPLAMLILKLKAGGEVLLGTVLPRWRTGDVLATASPVWPRADCHTLGKALSKDLNGNAETPRWCGFLFKGKELYSEQIKSWHFHPEGHFQKRCQIWDAGQQSMMHNSWHLSVEEDLSILSTTKWITTCDFFSFW